MEQTARTRKVSIGQRLTTAAALGAMVVGGTLATATPAAARDRDGVGAGEVIAGALVIGGIAAIAASASNNRDRTDGYGYADGYGGRYDDRYGRDGYDDGRYGWRDRSGYAWGTDNNPRRAVEACVAAAERAASRASWGGRADVTDIRRVQRRGGTVEVSGRIAVNGMGRDWRSGDSRYGRGWNGDYRGWNQNLRGYDAGSFTCDYRNGRVIDVDFRNIRGL